MCDRYQPEQQFFRPLHRLSISGLMRWMLAFAYGWITVAVGAQPVTLTEVDPNVDMRGGWRILLEEVVDPDDRRDGLVNFSFELDNISGDDLFLRGMTFTYRNSGGAVVHQESANAEEIQKYLMRYQTWDSNWAFAGSNPALIDLPWQDFEADWQHLEGQGYRMVDLEVDVIDGQQLFSGIFHRGTHAPAAIIHKPWSSFLAAWQDLETQGFRMIDLETYLDDDGQTRLFSGLLKPDTYSPAALVNLSWDDFHSQWSDYEDDGMRLFDLEIYTNNEGERFYSGLFRPGVYEPKSRVQLPWEGFLAEWQVLENQGYRLLDLETYLVAGQRLYSGIFQPDTFDPRASVNLTWDAFVEDLQALDGGGYRMYDLEILQVEGQRLYSGLYGPDAPLGDLPAGLPIRWEKDMDILFMAPQASFFFPRWPVEVEVRVVFDNAADVTFELPIEMYSNKNVDGSFLFPALQGDLVDDGFWSLGRHSGHEGPRLLTDQKHNNHRGALSINEGNFCFGQQYAYDLGVSRWNGSHWVTHGDGDENADYFIWETPLYAIEDGEVVFCHRDAEDNSTPGEKDSLVDGVPGGGNILFIQHTGGEVALYAHLRKNSIPPHLCENNGLQNPPVPVAKGELIGLVGNSGNSTAPHLHFHLQESWDPTVDGKAQGIPVLFNNLEVGRALTDSGSHWQDVDRKAVASGNKSILLRIDD